MTIKVIWVLALMAVAADALAWTSLQANHGEECGERPCNEEKLLVCNGNGVCECQLDKLTHAPLIFIEKLGECLSVAREEESGAVAQAQSHGGNSPGGGWGNSPQCITINTPCTYSSNCQRSYGNLAECKLHSYDQSLNRCQCCHPSLDTAFYNNKCYFVKRIGEACQSDEECQSSTENSECRRGVCSFRSGGGGGGGGNHGGNGGYGGRDFGNGGSRSSYISALFITFGSIILIV